MTTGVQARITSIKPLATAATAALMAFMLSFPVVALMKFFQAFDPTPPANPESTWFVWLVSTPLLVGFAFIAVLLSCITFNVACRATGGIQLDLALSLPSEKQGEA